MPLKLMYITNNVEIAVIAEKNGVDWIFIDLEVLGKAERQKGLDSVISKHNLKDIKKIKLALQKSKLLVRVNSIYSGSAQEISTAIYNGADIIMLPFFKSSQDVESFIQYVDGRAQICLLLETAEAVGDLDNILRLPGIDYIHIGINDLHLSYRKSFMFELLSDGTVERICEKLKASGITYGFGGIASLGQGALPAENIIAEHYRLGSTMAILSRSFCNVDIVKDINTVERIFGIETRKIRNYERFLRQQQPAFFRENQKNVIQKVKEILSQKAEMSKY